MPPDHCVRDPSLECIGSQRVDMLMTARDMQDVPIGTRNAPGLGMMFYFVMLRKIS